jgi:hypothetical protein
VRLPLAAALATLCACLSAPTDSLAQSTVYLRLLPEVAATSVTHTKLVTSAAGSSSSTSSTVTPEGGINFYLGYLRPAGENWMIGGEFRGTIYLQQDIEGTTPLAGSSTHRVWPGPWDFANRVGLGANLIVGRDLASINSRGYLFAGFARWNSDFRSAGADPASEELIDDEKKTGRWPLTTGIGLTLPFVRPLDIRLRYFRSSTSWSVSRDVNQEALEFDYSFVVNGLALSVGLGTR